MKSLAIAVFMAFMMVGCATDTVVKSKTEVFEPSGELLKQVTIPTPPSKEEYKAMNPAQKEDALTDYILELQRALAKANLKLGKLSTALDRTKTYFKEKEDK